MSLKKMIPKSIEDFIEVHRVENSDLSAFEIEQETFFV